MLITLIILLLVLLLFLVIDIIVYKTLSKCTTHLQEGKVYVRIISENTLYGWVKNLDIVSLQNNMKAREEHIRVETRDGNIVLVQVKSIKELNKVKSVLRTVIGNL